MFSLRKTVYFYREIRIAALLITVILYGGRFMVVYVILGICIILILALCIFSWKLSSLVIHPIVKGYEDTYQREIKGEKFDEKSYKAWRKTDFNIKSTYGYDLSCELIEDEAYENLEEKTKIMVMVHGITYSKFGSIKYTEMFIKRGFKVLIYDHRNHGLSGKGPTTMGFYEKYDLKTVIDWCYKTYGKDILLGTHGESMGAATVLAHLEVDKRPAFIIADCGYSDLRELLAHQLKVRYNLSPFPFIPVSNIFVKLRAGFNINKVSPIKEVAKTNTPILFVHGEKDDYVPTYMSEKMYVAKKDKKELYIAPNAAHAEAHWKNKKEYEERVNKFLDKYVFNNS